VIRVDSWLTPCLTPRRRETVGSAAVKGTARKRGPGKWQIQAYAGRDERTGRDVRVTRTVAAPHTRAGRKVVDQALAALIVEVETGRVNLGDDPTLAQLLDRWTDARSPEWSPKTVMENRRNIRLKIQPKLGKMRVSKIRPVHLDAFYAELRRSGGVNGKPLAPASVRKVHVILHAAFAQAIKWGLIASNPASAATAPSIPAGRITPPAPDALAQALVRIDEVDPDFGVFLRLAATTGARRSQLCALRWTDADLAGSTVTFARGLVDGGPGVGLVEKPTKTGLVWKVALAPGTVKRLETFRGVCEERASAVRAELPDDSFVFAVPQNGSRPWRPDNVTARWRRLRTKVGLDGCRLHDLRHYVATQLLGAGVDPRTVAGRLGHANPNVTMTVYGHFLPEKDRAAADLLDDLLDGTG
jgi:integrase